MASSLKLIDAYKISCGLGERTSLPVRQKPHFQTSPKDETSFVSCVEAGQFTVGDGEPKDVPHEYLAYRNKLTNKIYLRAKGTWKQVSF